MHGEVMFAAPSFANDDQRRMSTLLYIIGTFTAYASASFCLSGSSGIRAGINALLQARITFAARTPCTLPSRKYATRTLFDRSGSASGCTRTTVLLNLIRTGDAASSSAA